MPNSSAASEELTKLAQHISGYAGYENSESRATSDKAIRHGVINGIINLLQLLDGEFEADGDKTAATLRSHIESTQRKLKIICNSLEAPTYLQGDFFLTGGVNANRLERIYELEWEMLQETQNIKEELLMLGTGMSEETIKDHFLQINNFVDDLNQSLFEREALIIGEA